jgi:uncharacterized protein (DUF433 family)
MNIQLVDSLIQVIESLTPEESLLFQEKLSARAIQSTPGVCGGNARIRNTRIPVWTLVSLHQQGAREAELLRNYPGKVGSRFRECLALLRHREEIDRIIVSDRTE